MYSLFIKVICAVQNVILHLSAPFFRRAKSKGIVVGTTEIAGMLYRIGDIWSDLAVSVNLEPHPFYRSYRYTYKNPFRGILGGLYRCLTGPFLLAKLASDHDVFFYLWETGFCLDREIDFRFLSRRGKKIVTLFVGDDIRSRKLLLEHFRSLGLDSYIEYDLQNVERNESRVKRNAAIADKYASVVFSAPLDQMSYLRSPQRPWPYVVPDEVFHYDLAKFKESRLRIVHAPSAPILKGTQLVRAAIRKLQLEGFDFDYIELQNVPNEVVLRELARAHIVMNQFYSILPGVFGVEAMANCTATMMSTSPGDMGVDRNDIWLETRYWEVYDKLKALIQDRDLMARLAENGYQFTYSRYRPSAARESIERILAEGGVLI
jgi:hypothetical protein